MLARCLNSALRRAVAGWPVLGVALAALPVVAGTAAAQNVTKIKYAEVVRSLEFLPTYVALANGFFKEEGLDVDMTTAWGGDKGTAMLLAGTVDIVLQGPETAIYIENSESPEKTKMFAAITSTNGSFLVSREKMTMDQFKWDMIKGKTVLGNRPGGTPQLFLEYAMKKHGIDPTKDINNITNIAIPARVGAWISGRGDFAVFFEPDISRLEREGLAYPVTSVGKEVGAVDYTVFMATDSYIKKNPKVVQAWTNAIYKGQKWVQTADAAEAAKAIEPWFPKVGIEYIASSIERYHKFGILKTDPTTKPEAIEAMQDILIEGGILKKEDRVSYESIVTTKFSEAAKRTIN